MFTKNRQTVTNMVYLKVYILIGSTNKYLPMLSYQVVSAVCTITIIRHLPS